MKSPEGVPSVFLFLARSLRSDTNTAIAATATTPHMTETITVNHLPDQPEWVDAPLLVSSCWVEPLSEGRMMFSWEAVAALVWEGATVPAMLVITLSSFVARDCDTSGNIVRLSTEVGLGVEIVLSSELKLDPTEFEIVLLLPTSTLAPTLELELELLSDPDAGLTPALASPTSELVLEDESPTLTLNPADALELSCEYEPLLFPQNSCSDPALPAHAVASPDPTQTTQATVTPATEATPLSRHEQTAQSSRSLPVAFEHST